MLNFISIFFIFLSVLILIYLVGSFFSKRRVKLLTEIFFLLSYGFVAFIFLFPGILGWMEKKFGIPSAISFFVYLSIFLAYFLIFLMYRKTEEQRQEITQLTREISFLKVKKK